MLRAVILALVVAAGAFGCSRHAVRQQRLPDGSFEFRCDQELWMCLSHVDDVCKGRAYVVTNGWDEPRMAGTGDSSVESHESRAIVRCLGPGQVPKRVPPAPMRAPTVVQAVPDRPLPPRAPAPSPPPRACVPGATQACVGPAACSGGQACLADGSGFGPCDCGSK